MTTVYRSGYFSGLYSGIDRMSEVECQLRYGLDKKRAKQAFARMATSNGNDEVRSIKRNEK